MFGLITAASLFGLLLILTFLRFRKRQFSAVRSSRSFLLTYPSWLWRTTADLFKNEGRKKAVRHFSDWLKLSYPREQRWIFFTLAGSFSYLVLSGMVPAVGGLRLSGIFLVLHVFFGSLFALSLGAVVVLRARFYRFDEKSPDDKTSTSGLRLCAAFWIFTLCGLTQILTALSLMLPLFALSVEIDIFRAHEYSGLVALLSAIAFFYLSFFEENHG